MYMKTTVLNQEGHNATLRHQLNYKFRYLWGLIWKIVKEQKFLTSWQYNSIFFIAYDKTESAKCLHFHFYAEASGFLIFSMFSILAVQQPRQSGSSQSNMSGGRL